MSLCMVHFFHKNTCACTFRVQNLILSLVVPNNILVVQLLAVVQDKKPKVQVYIHVWLKKVSFIFVKKMNINWIQKSE